jgi:23S rRNA pseudouridine1911/1915/1917 synthase
VGDPLYGWRECARRVRSPETIGAVERFGRLALHASRLRLEHPLTGAQLDLEAPLPRDYRVLLATLRRVSR